MRWDGLFEDIEARWADLGWQGTVAEAAELTRAEWAGITLADRLRAAGTSWGDRPSTSGCGPWGGRGSAST